MGLAELRVYQAGLRPSDQDHAVDRLLDRVEGVSRRAVLERHQPDDLAARLIAERRQERGVAHPQIADHQDQRGAEQRQHQQHDAEALRPETLLVSVMMANNAIRTSFFIGV